MQLKAKIKNMALANHIPAQAVLQNFMLVQLLERISISNYAMALYELYQLRMYHVIPIR